jgi:quercetin dioxygenase-like cupin family protein
MPSQTFTETPASEYTEPNGLPQNHRHITTHDENGKAIYSKELSTSLKFWKIGTTDGQSARFELGYSTSGLPVQLNHDEDLSSFKDAYEKKQESGLVKHGGTILRFCDIPPKGISPMHRTNSLDYGILVCGSLECLLDSGESRTIYPGDVIVQRGTNHQWKNNTEKWARIVFLLFDATTLDVNGVPLEEDMGGMLVPQSH